MQARLRRCWAPLFQERSLGSDWRLRDVAAWQSRQCKEITRTKAARFCDIDGRNDNREIASNRRRCLCGAHKYIVAIPKVIALDLRSRRNLRGG